MLRMDALLLSFMIWSAGNFANGAVHQRELNLTAQASGLKFDIPDLIRPPSTTVSLPSIPSSCTKYTGSNKECTANITLDDATDALARVPVGLPRHVGTVMVMPGSSAHAYTYTNNGEIHFFGVQPANLDTRVYACCLGSTGDKCCQRERITNLAEDLAQMSVVKVYSLLNNDTLPPGFTTDCMSNQWAFLDSLPLYNPETLFGGSCSFEPDNAKAQHNIAPTVSFTASSSSMTITTSSSITKAVLASDSTSAAATPASTTPSVNSSYRSRIETGMRAPLALSLFVFLFQTV
ncbi:hypothetical protein IW262DRAFT_1462873 [Armillaria fumosa]|nr:hypothetical protein IW262DRAFT_1462873 [Armillaria fumosa]